MRILNEIHAQVPVDNLNEHLKELSTFGETDTGSGALDLAPRVERLLELLDWNVLSARETGRRVEASSGLYRFELRLEKSPVVRIHVYGSSQCLNKYPESIETNCPTHIWNLATNGRRWAFQGSPDRSSPTEILDIKDPAAREIIKECLARRYQMTRFSDLLGDLDAIADKAYQDARERMNQASDFRGMMASHGIRVRQDLSDQDIEKLLAKILSWPASFLEMVDGIAKPAAPSKEFPDEKVMDAYRNIQTGIDVVSTTQVKFNRAEIEWPPEATHLLTRKHCTSFIRYSSEDGSATLLPGSVMRAKTASSFPELHKRLRDEALASGQFVLEDEYIYVVSGYMCSSPSMAATLTAGTVTNGWKSWRDRDRNLIKRN